MSPEPAITSLADARRLKVNEAKVRAHVLRPAHVLGIVSSRGLEDAALLPRFTFTGTPGGLFYLDVPGFGTALHTALEDQVAGYAVRLQHEGSPVHARAWNWAKTADDGAESWASGVRMHVASCSKFITAVAMYKLLRERNLPLETAISGFLPTYWAKGPNIEKITFRHLMTHTSGFDSHLSDSDFQFMKDHVAAGVSGVGGEAYQNMNFGLCRILIATILGKISPDANFSFPPLPGVNDQFWDYITINAYEQYVRDAVFNPAGVSGPTFNHPDADALSYTFPVTGGGWNSGDLTSVCGGVGWHMSVDDLLAVMAAFRRANTIMSAADAQSLLDARFGIDEQTLTPLGWLYRKGGYWGDPMGHREQSNIYFLPRGMEMALLTNSPLGSPEKYLPDAIYNAYISNIRPANSLREFLQRHQRPTTSSVHALVGADRSIRQMLPN